MACAEESIETSRLINLIPVGLKEAAIDSPTSRATVQHLTEQVDLLDRWLDDYLKATNRLVAEHSTLENIVTNYISHAVLPTTVSETMLDHDYSVLAMRKYAEGAKDFWMSMVSVIKRLPTQVCEPIRLFQQNELKIFKETRKNIDTHQKHYDSLHAKFMALGKSKEPSSLREDAFQLHEARKNYLRAAMDLFQTAPQFRFKLDKMLIRIFCDQWKDMYQARESTSAVFQKNATEMDRVRGWVKEMENCEHSFQRELASARRQLEDEAELSSRPSRELDDYSASTMPSLGGHAHTTSNTSAVLTRSPGKGTFKQGERSGWLFLRTYTGKPVRAVWVKRWAFVRNGVFGWLIHDTRVGGVEESERLGVLLCAVRPAPQEERRFCFELKTNKNTVLLQADTQADLAAWIAAFEAAKSRAVNDPASSDSLATSSAPNSDPAFSISAPPVPEFGATVLASTEPGASEESHGLDKSNTLPIPTSENVRESFDVSRRGTVTEEGSRDHASRIMSKLDLGRRTPTTPQLSPLPLSPHPASGGIASLIAASHGSMPVGPSLPMVTRTDEPLTPRSAFTLALRDMPPSSLAPSTLANLPAPTSLSKAAVAVSGERGIRGSVTGRYGIPNGILANTWGSSNSSFVNRFDRSELRVVSDSKSPLQQSPMLLPSAFPSKSVSPNRSVVQDPLASAGDLALPLSAHRGRSTSPLKRYRNTISFDKNINRFDKAAALPDFPNYYPLQLKTQDAQFRLLFPNVGREDRLTMVFRATWNPSGQQDFPGRAYVTTKEMYFYSNHFGLVLTSGISLASVDEVTAAPGKDCDFLFVHFKETPLNGTSRITIKTFLEPLRLLQRRLNFLVKNSQSAEPQPLEGTIKQLLKMETEVLKRTPSLESYDDIEVTTPSERQRTRSATTAGELRSSIRIDRGLYGPISDSKSTTFKLPAQPVKYAPPGYNRLAVEREYDVSPKALFHVMFGDRSALWQLLQHERRAKNLKQGPWTPVGESRLMRTLSFSIPVPNILGKDVYYSVTDHQTVDVLNDHLCYVVTDRRTPWHLPFQSSHRLVTKVVITHVAKTKCKLALYIRVDWSADPWIFGVQRIINQHALNDLDLDAQDLADLVADQVRKLGSFSRTKKAIQIFGQVGHSSEITQLQIDASTHAIEMRRMPQRRGLATLLLQDFVFAVQSSLNTALQGIISVFGWISKTLSANSLILVILIASILYNSFFLTRDTWNWYHERKTTQFLSRLGIRPDTVMGRAIYVSDLSEAMTTTGIIPSTNSSACYSIFQDQYLINDIDSPLPISTTMSSSSDMTLQPARRLQQTRQILGGYRHDLLVAMRVVNSIEREVIRSEWGKWAVDEHRRCRAVQPLLGAGNDSTTAGLGFLGGKEDEKDGRLAGWYAEYCKSCTREYERVAGMEEW